MRKADRLREVAALLECSSGDDTERDRAIAAAATHLMFFGAIDLSKRLFDGITSSDVIVQAMLHHGRAVQAMFAGDVAVAVCCADAAAEMWTRGGDHRNHMTIRANTAYLHLCAGQIARAEELLRWTLATGDRMGLPIVIAISKHNLGYALYEQNRLAEARALEERAVSEFATMGDTRLEIAARIYLSEILLAQNDPRALTEARRAAAGQETGYRPYAFAVLARAELSYGTLEAARAADAIAFGHVSSTEEGEAMIHLAHIEVLLASGDTAGAREHAAKARARLEARAEKISDAELRRTFLSAVSTHRKTMETARRLEGAQ